MRRCVGASESTKIHNGFRSCTTCHPWLGILEKITKTSIFSKKRKKSIFQIFRQNGFSSCTPCHPGVKDPKMVLTVNHLAPGPRGTRKNLKYNDFIEKTIFKFLTQMGSGRAPLGTRGIGDLNNPKTGSDDAPLATRNSGP